MTPKNKKEENIESESQEEPAQKTEKKEKSPGKYVFECQKCGECCEKKDSVIVSMADLQRWSEDVTLPSLFQYLTLEVKDGDYVQISLMNAESEEGESESGCVMYDKENKICNIYFSMPLYCKSFPLGYDGDKYFLKDASCPGIGKGVMSEKSLGEARKIAKDDFEARVSTALLLPVIHGLTFKFIMEQSKKHIENLTENQKEKLRGVLGEDEGEYDAN
jgi:Fe-S-cluster containining protein